MGRMVVGKGRIIYGRLTSNSKSVIVRFCQNFANDVFNVIIEPLVFFPPGTGSLLCLHLYVTIPAIQHYMASSIMKTVFIFLVSIFFTLVAFAQGNQDSLVSNNNSTARTRFFKMKTKKPMANPKSIVLWSGFVISYDSADFKDYIKRYIKSIRKSYRESESARFDTLTQQDTLKLVPSKPNSRGLELFMVSCLEGKTRATLFYPSGNEPYGRIVRQRHYSREYYYYTTTGLFIFYWWPFYGCPSF